MNFLEKLFTKNSPKPNNKAAFDFLDHCHKNCEKWFENDYQSLSPEATRQAAQYVEQFGLEKNSNFFNLLPELKEAIAHYFQSCQIKCAANNIIVQVGIFELLQDLYQNIGIKKNEKILFALPISGYFIQQCHDNEIAVEFLNTDAQNGWKIDFAQLENILKNHKIKVLFLNYPSPTSGAVLSQSDVLALAEIIKQYPNLLVISDESLRELFVNKNRSVFSLAALEDIAAQIITISNLKCYGLDNLDIAFACLNQQNIIDALHRPQINISYTNQYIAIGALKASEDSQKHLAEMIAQCQQNFDVVTEELKIINENLSQKFGKKDDFIKSMNNELPISNSILLQFAGLKGSKGEIGNKTLETDLDMAEFLKQEAGIAMMPGQCSLLPKEEMILRLYLLKSKQELQAGFKKINQALLQLKTLSHNIAVRKSSKLSSKESDKTR
ncbi:MAG: aminotransferase class I/II-fold pyridoxal phosphate-dependent enzyme [Pseudomonadota bacterium]